MGSKYLVFILFGVFGGVGLVFIVVLIVFCLYWCLGKKSCGLGRMNGSIGGSVRGGFVCVIVFVVFMSCMGEVFIYM